MAGGILNLISVGTLNVILTGNPTKTFFKIAYSKYTNFGLQKFRIDFEGMRELRLTDDSKYTFKMKRYGDLLMDTYVVVSLPDIWSPIYPPSVDTNNEWSPYEFRWIQDIGAQMIREIEITCGNTVLQRYSGEYLSAMVQRDFNAEKKDLFDRMSGNITELNDPANWPARGTKVGAYPSAYYTDSQAGSEPSIRGRELYIPINAWFTLDSRCAFPLVNLQYNELIINITLRPISELFQVRDVFDASNGFPYVSPDFNQDRFQMYRFLQTPPTIDIASNHYLNQIRTWNTDVHLISTYCFLSNEERQKFASEDQVYLVKDIFEYNYLNVVGSTKVKLESSSGMVANWMWYLRRNDVLLRNEWSNYTNWPMRDVIPHNTTLGPIDISINRLTVPGPGEDGIYITGDFAPINRRDILETLGIVFDGDYRENLFPRGLYDYVEKYTRTAGSAREGLQCYNFCLNTSPFEYQPSGAINLSKFKTIELELTTFLPPIDVNGSNVNVVCDETGTPISVSTKPGWALYKYNYDMHIFEERYNILSFIGGNCSLMYAR
jgi:Major capsid protein N-terminus/Large eukaryotic DNA virus major capsid protein